jgi:hypothetical protein
VTDWNDPKAVGRDILRPQMIQNAYESMRSQFAPNAQIVCLKAIDGLPIDYCEIVQVFCEKDSATILTLKVAPLSSAIAPNQIFNLEPIKTIGDYSGKWASCGQYAVANTLIMIQHLPDVMQEARS